jgi:hypothetical protein
VGDRNGVDFGWEINGSLVLIVSQVVGGKSQSEGGLLADKLDKSKLIIEVDTLFSGISG